MKKIIVTAAALMLGTSALAWAPAEEGNLAGSEITAAKSPLAFAAFEGKSALKSAESTLETSAAWSKSDDDMMSVPKAFAKWEDPSVGTAATASADMSDVKSAVQTAGWDEKTEPSTQSASVDPGKETGMGGPLEEAASGYPACTPGRGDDHCIQLYARGVHQSLAAWKGSDASVAMGGPYEPVADAGGKDDSVSMNDHSGMDHAATPADGAIADKPATMATDTSATTTKPAATSTTAASPGVGGPIEARTGYPVCSRTVTDSCIQLHERGVTGRGN